MEIKIEDLLEKDVVTQEDMNELINHLKEMKSDTEKLLDLKGEGLSHGVRGMMLTDIDFFKRFIEMMSDLAGEDFDHQDRIKKFLEVLMERLRLTVYKRILPLVNSLKGEVQ